MSGSRYGGLLDTIRRWWSSDGEGRPEGKDVAEEIHKKLPESLSARRAIEEDRRRKAQMDRMLEEDR